MILEHLDYWHWWILGVVLLVLEVFAPGAFFLWIGVAAGVVGVALFFFPHLGWEDQLLIFGVLSVVSIVVWRMYLHHHPTATDRPTLNRRGEQYVGRTFTLEEAMLNGVGKLRVDDSTWKIEGEDCSAGEKVKVVGVDGTVLKVERV